MAVRQLSGLDAEFLAMESGPVLGHFGTVTVLDGAERLDLAALRAHVAARVHRVPVLRQRVMPVVLGVDQPYWVDDPDFTVDRHVHESTVPAPGGPGELARVVALLHERRLDRRHPLWQAHLLRGLAGGRVAVYCKIHHAMMDGVGGGALVEALFDPVPEDGARPGAPEDGAPLGAPEEAAPWHPDRPPTQLDLLSRGAWTMTRSGLRSARLGVEAMVRAPLLAQGLFRRVVGEPQPDDVARLPVRAPRTPFNAEIGPDRAWASVDLPLPEVKAVGAAAGATVNHVVMALCAGVLRRWLLGRGVLPQLPLIAVVPVSERTGREPSPFGNRLALVRAVLPTHLDDARERLDAVREEMAAALQRHESWPRGLMSDAAEYAPPMVAEVGWWVSAQVMRHLNAFNLMISNVRGPETALHLLGARVVAHYPVSVLVHGQGLNISVVGLGDRLCFGLVADPSLVPDLDGLAALLHEELAALAIAGCRPSGRSTSSQKPVNET